MEKKLYHIDLICYQNSKFMSKQGIRTQILQIGSYTVRKMGLILRSIERMLKMQFSMARSFTLQPLRRYDVKPPKKQHKRNVTLDAPCLQKAN